jgi:hypothetical protein
MSSCIVFSIVILFVFWFFCYSVQPDYYCSFFEKISKKIYLCQQTQYLDFKNEECWIIKHGDVIHIRYKKKDGMVYLMIEKTQKIVLSLNEEGKLSYWKVSIYSKKYPTVSGITIAAIKLLIAEIEKKITLTVIEKK